MQAFLAFIEALDWIGITSLFLGLNLFVLIAAAGLRGSISYAFASRGLHVRDQPYCLHDVGAALRTMALNVAVSVVGWYFWRLGLIELVPGPALVIVADTMVMIVAMDLGMYLTHRMAHHPLAFALVHGRHHEHRGTNALSLFVMHPVEVLGFGGLMLAFLAIYPMHPLALVIYLHLNVFFGVLGHAGVEPLPQSALKAPGLRWLGTSSFHGAHHTNPHANFGFYTQIWDRLFGTLQL